MMVYENAHPQSDDLLTLAEVARMMGITPGTAARRCRAGKFPGARLVTGSGRGFWRVPRAALVGVSRDNRGRKARRCGMVKWVGLGAERRCGEQAVAILDAGTTQSTPVCAECAAHCHPDRLSR